MFQNREFLKAVPFSYFNKEITRKEQKLDEIIF